jgi:hypothetical protein
MFTELVQVAETEIAEYEAAAVVVTDAQTARDAAQTALEAAQGTAGTEKGEAIAALQALLAAVQAKIDELA